MSNKTTIKSGAFSGLVTKIKDWLTSMKDSFFNFNFLNLFKILGQAVKYVLFNTGVKLIMYCFEIMVLIAFAIALYFLFDMYVSHKVGIALVQFSRDDLQLKTAMQYNQELHTFIPIIGNYVTIVAALATATGALFVQLISHILLKNKRANQDKK